MDAYMYQKCLLAIKPLYTIGGISFFVCLASLCA